MRCFVSGMLSALFACLLAMPASAAGPAPYEQKKFETNTNVVTVEAAGSGGTYLPIAEDLQNILDDAKGNGFRVMPMIGRGGGQNLTDLLFLKGVDIVIAQQEHITYLKKQNPVLYANIENKVQYITKLYDSEFHLLARKDIKSYQDLEGKTVNLYKPMSAGDIAGRTIFDLIGVHPIIVNYDLKTSIEMLKKGEIAATGYLGGAPIAGYAELKDTENLKFLPLDEDSVGPDAYFKLLEVFLPAKLEAKSYPLLIDANRPVSTVSSGALLAAFNFADGTPQQQKIAEFTTRFFENFDKFLQPPRHPKWREVNLSAQVVGWKRLKAAQQWLDTHKASVAKSDELRAAFTRFLDKYAKEGNVNLTEDQQKKLWALFQESFSGYAANGGWR